MKQSNLSVANNVCVYTDCEFSCKIIASCKFVILTLFLCVLGGPPHSNIDLSIHQEFFNEILSSVVYLTLLKSSTKWREV